MMKKMWKRMLAILLTVLMLGGAAPLGAMAAAITASAEDEKDSILEFLQDYFFPYFCNSNSRMSLTFPLHRTAAFCPICL